MPDLVIVVPTRGRPDAVAELAQECAKTCTADTVLLVVVDMDDPTLPSYRDLPRQGFRFDMVTTVSTGHVAAINYGATVALSYQPFAVGKLDDDHRPRTRGWDTQLLAAVREGGIAYGNDLLQGRNLPTAPVITTNIIQALGFMGPPTLQHLYVDNYWKDLGEQAGCLHYVPSIVIEHMHPVAGKSPWTEGHRRVNDPAQFERDGGLYERYKAEHLPADVAKVKALR